MNIKSFVAATAIALSSVGAFSAELVSNGSFDAGMAGWTNADNTRYSSISYQSGGHGNVWRDGSVGTTLGTISQTLSTVAGTAYTLSFDLQGTGTPNKVKVWFGEDIVAFAQTNFNLPNWTHYTVTGLMADSNSSVLKFGSRNDPSFNMIDNISVTGAVTPVPEPEAFAMLLAGLGLMGTIARRRNKASVTTA